MVVFAGYSSDSLLIAGSPSIALSRDDPMRLMYIRAFPAALEAAFTGEPAKLAALFADFQIEVLVDQNPSLEVWENLTVRQERRREYIKSIILQVAASLPSELRGGQGFATAMKSLAFKRLMLYNLIEQFPLASFGQGQKPGGTLESLETFVVSSPLLRICHAKFYKVFAKSVSKRFAGCSQDCLLLARSPFIQFSPYNLFLLVHMNCLGAQRNHYLSYIYLVSCC